MLCRNPECFGLSRPSFPMGRAKAMHILLYHGGDKIVDTPEARDLDPTGEFGEAIIDRTLKLMDDYENTPGTRAPYKSAKSRRIFCTMLGEAEKDIQDIVQKAQVQSCGNSSESAGAGG